MRFRLLDHTDPRIQEQALNIIRNLSENEEGIDLVFSEIGTDNLLDRLWAALESSDDDVTLQATLALANLVSSSEPNYTTRISNFPRMLPILHSCLSDRKTDIRRPVSSIVCELARMGGSEVRKALLEEGFGGTLRWIVEWAGSLGSSAPPSGPMLHVGSLTTTTTTISRRSTSPSQGTYAGSRPVSTARHDHSPTIRNRELSQPAHSPTTTTTRYHRIDEDKKLTDMSRLALDWLEHGDVYNGCI
jgi:hypothetical protein